MMRRGWAAVSDSIDRGRGVLGGLRRSNKNTGGCNGRSCELAAGRQCSVVDAEIAVAGRFI